MYYLKFVPFLVRNVTDNYNKLEKKYGFRVLEPEEVIFFTILAKFLESEHLYDLLVLFLYVYDSVGPPIRLIYTFKISFINHFISVCYPFAIPSSVPVLCYIISYAVYI